MIENNESPQEVMFSGYNLILNIHCRIYYKLVTIHEKIVLPTYLDN